MKSAGVRKRRYGHDKEQNKVRDQDEPEKGSDFFEDERGKGDRADGEAVRR